MDQHHQRDQLAKKPRIKLIGWWVVNWSYRTPEHLIVAAIEFCRRRNEKEKR